MYVLENVNIYVYSLPDVIITEQAVFWSAQIPQSVSIGCPSARQQSLLHRGPQLLLCHILFTPGAMAMFDLFAEKPKRQSQKHITRNRDMSERKGQFKSRHLLGWCQKCVITITISEYTYKKKYRFNGKRMFLLFIHMEAILENTSTVKHEPGTGTEVQIFVKCFKTKSFHITYSTIK